MALSAGQVLADELGAKERVSWSWSTTPNADETRLGADALSGGETFLASLALALALADQIGELAAEGAPRLESIFLDEGFGTLDPETLDVVIDAIESLRSEDRVAGLAEPRGRPGGACAGALRRRRTASGLTGGAADT
ncbi:MAG: SbcC/MukB-like Walker B domain-containing protein [Acidimicrobiia bacterium]|nr:SbcC/MukB-like Walker B domain-containing protein [Acidimicrobiia bacterium]